jgi:hypothetical protein
VIARTGGDPMPPQPDGGHPVSDGQDDQRPAPEGDAPAAPPWSATPAQPDGDGERRPSWELPQGPTGGQPNRGGPQGPQPTPPPPYGPAPQDGRPARPVALTSQTLLPQQDDAHLVTGGLIDLERIAPATRQAYLELSAAVSDGFALPPLKRKPAAQA